MANESPPDPENGEGRPPRRSRPTHELLEHSLLSLKDTEGESLRSNSIHGCAAI